MKRIILTMALCAISLFIINAQAQTVKDLELQNKDLMKTLKNQQGVKKVEIRIETDGYWYYLLTAKGNMLGVADKSGKVIIQPAFEGIAYYPALPEEVTAVKGNSAFGPFEAKYYHHQCDPVFLAKMSFNESKLIDVHGVILRDHIVGNIERLPGYWLINNCSIEQKACLLSSDGKVLVAPQYYTINIDDDACLFEKKENGMIYKGAMSLHDTSLVIPCIFNDILCHHGRFDVKLRDVDEYESYHPNKNYGMKFHDDGEKYYELKDYDRVIDYYAKEGVKAPWAKFYTAMSLRKKASDHLGIAVSVSVCIEKNLQMTDAERKFSFDPNLVRQQNMIVAQLLQAYLQEDTTFAETAKSELGMCNFDLNENIEKTLHRYNNALAILKQRNEQNQLAEIARQQTLQKQRSEMMMNLLGSFANALTNKSTSKGSASNIIQSTSNVSGTSNSSSNSNPQLLAEWKDRRDNAQKHYQAAAKEYSRNPNPLTKKNLNDCADILRTCEENVAKYQ